MKLNPSGRIGLRTAEQRRGRGRLNNVYQQFRNGNQNQNQLQQLQDEIENPKINRFTPIRKELCRQFAQQTTEPPGSEIWIDDLLAFFMVRGQFGVTRESIKVWYGRQPTFFQSGMSRPGNGAGVQNGRNGAQKRSTPRNSNGNLNNNFTIPAQAQVQQQQTFQQYPNAFSYPFQMQMPMQIQTPSPSLVQNQIPPNPTPNSAPISAELLDYQQKREDFNNSFEYIRQLHNIFMRQENLATCLIHLEKIQLVCSRANNKLVLPSTYRDNTKERLGQLARMMKQEMGHVQNQENEQDGGNFSAQEEEDPEMVILS